MEIDVKQSKQRNKRRERAQRMIAERDKDAASDGAATSGGPTAGGPGSMGAGGPGGCGLDPDDSADEDMPVSREKPPRPTVRRKRKEKDPSPVLEEDIIDGFAILAFKSYEDLEFAIKIAQKRNEKRLSAIVELTSMMVDDKPPKIIDTTAQKLDQQKANNERLAAEAARDSWQAAISNNNNNNNSNDSDHQWDGRRGRQHTERSQYCWCNQRWWTRHLQQ